MTTDLEQVPFNTTDFVDNPENRCPCVLVLDTSGSMQGRPIAEAWSTLSAGRSRA